MAATLLSTHALAAFGGNWAPSVTEAAPLAFFSADLILNLIALNGRMDALLRRSGAAAPGAVCILVLPAILAASLALPSDMALPPALLVACWAIFGAGTAWAFLQWASVLQTMQLWAIALWAATGAALSQIIQAVSPYASHGAFAAALLVLTGASLILLFRPLYGKPSEPSSQATRIATELQRPSYGPMAAALWRPLVGAVLCALIAGFGWSPELAADTLSLYGSLASFALMALMCLMLFAMRSAFSLERLCGLLLPLGATALIVVPFVVDLDNSLASALAYPLNALAFFFFDSLIWVCAIATAQRECRDARSYIAFSRACCATAMIVGMACSPIDDAFAIQVAFLIALVLYLLAMTLIQPGSRVARVVVDAPEASTTLPSVEDAVASLTSERGLSPREGEVFSYVARGHGSPYIAEKLTLSNETVKTHIKRIYRKLGVGSRDELLALVEARRRELQGGRLC